MLDKQLDASTRSELASLFMRIILPRAIFTEHFYCKDLQMAFTKIIYLYLVFIPTIFFAFIVIILQTFYPAGILSFSHED